MYKKPLNLNKIKILKKQGFFFVFVKLPEFLSKNFQNFPARPSQETTKIFRAQPSREVPKHFRACTHSYACVHKKYNLKNCLKEILKSLMLLDTAQKENINKTNLRKLQQKFGQKLNDLVGTILNTILDHYLKNYLINKNVLHQF